MEVLTYLHSNLKNDCIRRWPDNCFPLKFYVAPFRWYARQNNDTYKYQALVHRALKAWEQASGGKVRFSIVDKKLDSQIDLDWIRVDRKALGYCHFNNDDVRLYSAEVQIGLSDGILHQQYQDENEVYHTILHEIGHALGLGHSQNKNDIMYTPHRYGTVNLSQGDAASIQWLYKLPCGANISEIAKKYNIASNDIDYIIASISNKGKSNEFENVKNSIKLPQKDLMNEQDKIAELKKYNLGLQNIQISQDVKEYLKKNVMMKKDNKKLF